MKRVAHMLFQAIKLEKEIKMNFWIKHRISIADKSEWKQCTLTPKVSKMVNQQHLPI